MCYIDFSYGIERLYDDAPGCALVWRSRERIFAMYGFLSVVYIYMRGDNAGILTGIEECFELGFSRLFRCFSFFFLRENIELGKLYTYLENLIKF